MAYLPEDDCERPDVRLGGVSVTSKNLRSTPLHPDLFVCLSNELVVDDGTSSAEVRQLNDEVLADVETVRRQLAVHDKPVNTDASSTDLYQTKV